MKNINITTVWSVTEFHNKQKNSQDLYAVQFIILKAKTAHSDRDAILNFADDGFILLTRDCVSFLIKISY